VPQCTDFVLFIEQNEMQYISTKFQGSKYLIILNRNQSSEGIKLTGAVDVDILKEL
jgi:hypothetical protein